MRRLRRRDPARVSVALACVLSFGQAAACDRPVDGRPPAAAPLAVVDGSGRTVELAAPATRIVSLVPALTDVVLALGGANRLVARTRYDTDPRLASLPSLEDALTPSVEWIVAQGPDLVISWADRQARTVSSRLSELGIPVYTSATETLDQMRAGIRDIGTLLGRETAADSLLGRLRGAIDSVRTVAAGRDTVAVLYLIGLDPPMAAGPGSFIDELIGIAGGRNIFGDASAAWPPVSVEEIVARKPDVILIATAAPADEVRDRLSGMPGLRSLDAVSEARVRVLDPSLFNRPGPGLIDAVRELARAVHPDARAP